MSAKVVTSVSTIGSSTVYSDTIRVDSTVNPIVTTIVGPASVIQTTVSGGPSDPFTTITSDGTTLTQAQIAFIYITSTTIPGGTTTSTIGYATSYVTSSGRIAVATVPVLGLATLTITNVANPTVILSAPPTLLSSPLPTLSTLTTSRTSSTTSQTSPTAEASPLNPSSSSKPPSSATIGGIVSGAVLGILIITILLFIIVRRKRRRHAEKQSALPPTVAYHGKHELAGDQPPSGANHWLPGVLRTRVKPELEASVQQCAELENGNATAVYKRLSEPMSNSIHEAPVPSDSASTVASNTPLITAPAQSHSPTQHEVLQPIHNSNALNQPPQRHRHATSQPTNETDSPKYFVTGPVSSPTRHSMSAVQHQRGLPESNGPGQVPDSLSQLRAEHEALMDRIRLAEMRERERGMGR